MENLPIYISLAFILTTILTVGLFYWANKKSTITLIILLAWFVAQSIIGSTGFYTVTNTLPPRFILLVLPPVVCIAALFMSKKGRVYIDSFDLKTLTILHIIRIPVEILLYWLFLHKAIPELMTFAGRNFDILAGLTAPIIFYFGFIKNQISRKIILIWNFICLGLLINIILNGIFSAPFPFQQFAFDQPNVAVLHYPFNLLPSCVVALVLFSHLISIRKLLYNK